ncbi:MAG: F0F1 ATP synthase subunit delta [Treponema sp.]|jgi:F0F1-type ATP synthase delta subunit|nr:F0F1 ATP synthase subunit delta [Treponema sp.]
MFRPEPWARAFLRGLEPEESGRAFEALKLYCAAALTIPGEAAGLNDAKRFAVIIDRTLEKAGLSGPDARAAAYARNFFLLMVRKGCLYQHKKIAGRIRDILDKNEGTVRAVLEAPFEPDAAFIESLKQRLGKKMNAGNVELSCCLFPELVGGFRIRIGSALFDESLKTRLAKMASDLGGAARRN